MKTFESCANRCLSRTKRDIFVVTMAALTLGACGGSVTSGDSSSNDGGGADAGADAAHDAATHDASADCVNAVAGGTCTHEGESCSQGSCSDPCQFCNVLVCMSGVWGDLEAPPEPCVDGSARVYPDARMAWQGPGGFAGTGPAIIVEGSGDVRVWQSTSSFDPTSAPMAAPDATLHVDGAAIDALFTAWVATTTSGLPHGNDSAECYANVTVTTCASCAPSSVRYTATTQVTPELENVWSWFDANLPAMPAATRTRNYCHF